MTNSVSAETMIERTGRRLKKCLFVISLLWFFSARGIGEARAANVATLIYIPSELQGGLIASVTDQWVATVAQGSFYKTVTISAKKPEAEPPPQPVPEGTDCIRLSSGSYFVGIGDEDKTVYKDPYSVNEIYAYGWVEGVEYERNENVKQIGFMRDEVVINNSCSGLLPSTTDAAQAFVEGCYTTYNLVESSITYKNGTPTVLQPIFPRP